MKKISIETYSKAVQLRSISKKIQQISWSLSKLEQKFDIDGLKTEEELSAMVDTYTRLVNSYKQGLNDLNELNELTTTNEQEY